MRSTALLLALLGTASAECPNACSGHGECGVFDQCSCYRNWQGNDCSERTCPFGHAHVDSPKGDLNMDGGALSPPSQPVVINSEVYPLGTTEQYPDAQSNEAHFYMECSNKGLCDRKSGECECFDGYDGASCQRASCPGGIGGDSEQCSGHGTCHSISYLAEHHSMAELPLSQNDQASYKLWDAGYTRGCLCDPPFSGPDCAARDCKYGVDPLYTSTGTALYQKAFVVNACGVSPSDSTSAQYTNGGSAGDMTTNGIVHQYASSAYSGTGGTIGESRLTYTGSLTLSGVAVVPAWAVNGAEVVAMAGTSPNIGCRLGVVDATTDGTDTTLYVNSAESSTTMDALKCETSGAPTDSNSYTVFFVENTFTLLFTDHHGEVYRTAPISAGVADYSVEIKAALEGLPNNVIKQVNVAGAMVDPAGSISGNTLTANVNEMAYHIDFVTNPGTLGELKIDSTPIRLGQKLVAGIECAEDSRYVYSKVGYREIGEDTSAFSSYAGNIAYFDRKSVLQGTVTTADTVSGKENNIIYTSADMSGSVSVGDLIKIQDEVYVVDGIGADYIQLNTHFKGAEVAGVSTQIHPNDGNNADAPAAIEMEFTGATTLTLPAFPYSVASIDTDGTTYYTARTTGFSAGDRLRVTFQEGTEGYEFDCIFTISAVTGTATTDDFTATAGDDSDSFTNEFDYVLTVVDADVTCPTFSDAYTDAGQALDVNLYAFSASALTNGQYADNTRIFHSDHTATLGGASDADAVVTARLGGNKVTAATLAGVSAGDVVLIENEFNIVESVSTNDVVLKNAYANENSLFTTAGEFNDGTATEMIGYNSEKIYKVTLATLDASDYTYVSQCSNRGLCDGSSGICQCFKGYTGDNCDTISELYA